MATFELREYHLRFDRVAEFLRTFESMGRPLLADCGFDILGAWLPDAGPNTGTAFTWMLRWPDLNARTAALERLRSHSDYPAFAAATKNDITQIDTRLLRPLPFSPML